MTREFGIPWSDPMVLALLAGTKTQTRRAAKFQFYEGQNPDFSGYTLGHYMTGVPTSGYVLRSRGAGGCWNDRTKPLHPRYRVGDLVWGREAWGVAYSDTGWVYGFTLNYRADKTQLPFFPSAQSMPDTIGKIKTLHEKWRPPMFFPRWASRLMHEVTAVRAERLGEISEEDAIAEGITVAVGRDRPAALGPGHVYGWPGSETLYTSARAAYFAGFDSINGKGAAAKNPWVWVITFRPWDSTLEHEGGCVCTACRFAVQRAGAEAGW